MESAQSAVIVVIFDSEKVDAKNVVRKIKKVVAISGSRGGGLQKTAAGLTARHCDVGLTLRYRRRRGK